MATRSSYANFALVASRTAYLTACRSLSTMATRSSRVIMEIRRKVTKL
jgi:hypothetical protein